MMISMKPIPNSAYIPRGDLAARAGLLAARLEKKEYRPDTVKKGDANWPGDWEGRTILALVRIAETTKKEPAYLDDIVDGVLSVLNERGYLGPIYEDGVANEQQLSGHSWLLRGLCAYYAYSHRSDIYDAALKIGQNLFLPLTETYKSYPILPEERVYAGDMGGSIAKTVGKWLISTDTGCAYIPLDGVSALFEMTHDAEIGQLLEEMIELFLKIDFTGICAQTHATLTGTRGILRTYRETGKEEYLEDAKKLFSMYTEYGMTANYANYNWFGRPEWTEPCAVVDSFICAMQLYAATGERDYITTAQRIYYNGMGFGQRENGGFGCDTCLGAVGVPDNRFISKHCEEAYWCCTMRGGEGIASVAEYAYLTDGNTVCVPYFSSSDAQITLPAGKIGIRQRTSYPYEGKVVFTVTENTLNSPVSLVCYLPDTADCVIVDGASYSVDGGMLYIALNSSVREIRVSFSMPYHKETPVGAHNEKDVYAIFRGNLMYGVTVQKDSPQPTADELLSELNETASESVKLIARPLFDAYETDHAPRLVLFS
ncbi:MAG: hypothetical protein ACI4XJ_10925 [Eubacteriales bacterium]